jgi:hypothetical protein
MSFIDHDFDFATDADFDAFITDAPITAAPVAAYLNHGDTFDVEPLHKTGRGGAFASVEEVEALKRTHQRAAEAEAARLLETDNDNADEIAALVHSSGDSFGLDHRNYVLVGDGVDGSELADSYDGNIDSDVLTIIASENRDDEGITDVRNLAHQHGGFDIAGFQAHVARQAKARRYGGIEDIVFDKRGRVRGGATGKVYKASGKPSRAERVAAIRARRR